MSGREAARRNQTTKFTAEEKCEKLFHFPPRLFDEQFFIILLSSSTVFSVLLLSHSLVHIIEKWREIKQKQKKYEKRAREIFENVLLVLCKVVPGFVLYSALFVFVEYKFIPSMMICL